MSTRLRHPADRICLVLLTGIGDVVHGLPLANALKRDDPSRHITWIAEPVPAEVLTAHPSVDDVVRFDRRAGLRGVRALRRALAGRRFDLTLNLQRYFKSIFPTLFSRAPHRVGLDRSRVRDGVWLACNHHLPPRPWAHTQDVFLEFADYLGLPRPDPLRWEIALTAEESRQQRAFFRRFDGRPVVSLVLASANPRKDWPAERYVELADVLASDFGLAVVLAGGPGARERRAAEALVRRCRSRPLAALGADLRRLIWLLDGSALFIGPDTGPLHIAHALGTPVIGLFGHTNPWRVGPYNRYRELIVDRYTEPWEDPDPGRTEPRRGRMERITVADVVGKVTLALERYVRPSGPEPSGPQPPVGA